MSKAMICKRFFAGMISFALLTGCSTLAAETPADTPLPAEAAVPETPDPSIQTDSSDLITQVIENTFSARNFTSGEVSADQLKTILQNGHRAPSARNFQPWHFTAITNHETASSIIEAVPEGGVVIVVSGPIQTEEGINVDFDCGLAVENMYLTAQSLGLGAHIYTGPVSKVNESMLELLEIPEGFEAVSILCIGFVEDFQDAVSSASVRKELSEIVNYID